MRSFTTGKQCLGNAKGGTDFHCAGVNIGRAGFTNGARGFVDDEAIDAVLAERTRQRKTYGTGSNDEDIGTRMLRHAS